MNVLIGLIMGYIAHDALKPTAIGKVLDKVALPADLFGPNAQEPEPAKHS